MPYLLCAKILSSFSIAYKKFFMRAAWTASQPWWLHLFPRQGSSPLEDLHAHRAKNIEQRGPLCSRSERASESSAFVIVVTLV